MTGRNPPHFSDTLDHARQLRRQSSDAEKMLWRHLRGKRLRGTKFRRQHPVGPYVVDFYCEDRRLVIELDGGGHGTREQGAADVARTHELKLLGLQVIRFWNNQVLQNIEAVLTAIDEALARPSP